MAALMGLRECAALSFMSGATAKIKKAEWRNPIRNPHGHRRRTNDTKQVEHRDRSDQRNLHTECDARRARLGNTDPALS